jgi:hypothetical protein
MARQVRSAKLETRTSRLKLEPRRKPFFVLLSPRQQAKLARGAKDKEHAMSQTPNSAIAVTGIDIGKNWFHVVGHDARSAIVLRQKWSRGASGSAARQCTALPDRHGSLRRRTSPEPQTRVAWSRCQVDAGQICSPL